MCKPKWWRARRYRHRKVDPSKHVERSYRAPEYRHLPRTESQEEWGEWEYLHPDDMRAHINEAFGRAGGPVNVDPGKTVTMNLPKWVQWLGGPTRTSINLQGPAYIPSTDTIGMAGEKGLGTAWHELGHAHQPFYRKTLHPAASGLRQLLGSAPGLLQRWGPALGSLGAAFRGDKDQARNAALLGSGLTLPNLAVEAGASLRGARMMTGGGSPFNRLRTFRGLPTYMALSALPLLAYATRNAVGGFGSPKSS